MTQDTTRWWWLSFADGRRPKGTQFLGASFIQAETFPEAVALAWAAGCNPGGEVLGIEAPAGFVLPRDLQHYAGRLLSKAEAMAFDEHLCGVTVGSA